ncbi:hypothetical protein H113_00001 [Trichophyton rubrum MR1459]|nr:hypothetical protein H113_00001 [Trichophyton rubrum MR1459]EZG11270.1 hypothetical protein H106_00002 [Trichophyton rubrum CBS 735.88]
MLYCAMPSHRLSKNAQLLFYFLFVFPFLLNNLSLDLFYLLYIDVSPNSGGSKSDRPYSSTGCEHTGLRTSISALDGDSTRGADRVAELDFQLAEDFKKIGLFLDGEVFEEFGWEDGLPDGTGNGKTDSSANGREHR